MTTISPPAGESMICSPQQAIRLLQEGNERFAAGKPKRPHADAARRGEIAREGQHPFAVLLTCFDSRVPAEILFDAGIGDMFVARVAGNIVDTNQLASIEFAAEHMEVPLAVVLGHTQCAAIAAAVNNTRLHGSLPQLINRIKPAVEMARLEHFGTSGGDLLSRAIEANVRRSVAELLRGSDVLRRRTERGDLQIVGAIYNVETGRVEWLPAGTEGDSPRLPR